MFYDILSFTRADAAAALSDTHFIRHIFSHHRAKMQQPWQSLRSLSALVHFCLI